MKPENTGGINLIYIPTVRDILFIKPAINYLEGKATNQEGKWGARVDHQPAIRFTRYRETNIANDRPHSFQPLPCWEEINKIMMKMKIRKVNIEFNKHRELYTKSSLEESRRAKYLRWNGQAGET